MAIRLLNELCDGDPRKVTEAIESAEIAIEIDWFSGTGCLLRSEAKDCCLSDLLIAEKRIYNRIKKCGIDL